MAEEICNDTFYRFYQTIHQFKEKSGVFTWLARLAHNKIVDHFKNNKNGKLKLLSLDNDFEQGLEKYLELNIELEMEKDLCYERCVSNVIAKSKNTHLANCITVLIFVVQGLSIKEIAIKIDRTPNATAVFISSCRKKLSKQSNIKNCWEECKKLSKFGRKKRN